MKRFAVALSLAFIGGCTMVPNLGGGEMVRGTVSASGSNVKVAVIQGAGTDLTGAEVVPVVQNQFTYMLPQDADALTIVAFRDENGNGKYDDGEPNSMNTSGGSTYLQLTRLNEKWVIVEHSSGGTSQKDNLAGANLSLG